MVRDTIVFLATVTHQQSEWILRFIVETCSQSVVATLQKLRPAESLFHNSITHYILASIIPLNISFRPSLSATRC